MESQEVPVQSSRAPGSPHACVPGPVLEQLKPEDGQNSRPGTYHEIKGWDRGKPEEIPERRDKQDKEQAAECAGKDPAESLIR